MNDDDNNQFVDMIGKIVVGFTSKFDGISERINEKTGWHIDVGKIVGVDAPSLSGHKGDNDVP